MKLHYIFLLILFPVVMAFESSDDMLGIKKPISFNDTLFSLAWAANPRVNYYVQEYLPKGETLQEFNQMLTIHLFEIDIDPIDAVSQRVADLMERKKSDEVCNFLVSESPDGKEFMVDFLVSESDEETLSIVEFNIYRYKQIELAKKKKALVVFCYSKRAYGEEIMPFLNSLKDSRENHLHQMIRADIPKIKLKK